MVAAVAALVSFQESSQLLAELAGVSVDSNHVQPAAESLGLEVAEQEKREFEAESEVPLAPRFTSELMARAYRCGFPNCTAVPATA